MGRVRCSSPPRRPIDARAAGALAGLCLLAGCRPARSHDTSLTLALVPESSCLGSPDVALVHRLDVMLTYEGTKTLLARIEDFQIDGAEISLGSLPREGTGRFDVEGIATHCEAEAEVFQGGAEVTFLPDADQRVAIPVACASLLPCPEPEPTGPVFTTFQSADLVVGQPDHLTCNGGGLPNPQARFREPDGLALSAGTLWVADRGYNRVAAFNGPATLSSGVQLSFAVGQDNIGTTAPEGSPNADDVNRPRGVLALPDRLVVTDTDDNRGLIYAPLPAMSNPNADFAIGQNGPGGGSGAGTAIDRLSDPWGLTMAGNTLFLADAGNHRVLAFDTLSQNRPAAVLVLGQANFTSGAPNQGLGAAGDATLSTPAHLSADGGYLWVADSGNNRVVRYTISGLSNGAPATLVLTGAGGVPFSAPRGVAAHGGRLVIADSGNHRVLVWERAPASASTPPDAILGQPDASGVVANADGAPGACPAQDTCGASPATKLPTARSLFRPGAVLLAGNDELWVSDTCNNRVLRFHAK